MKAKLTKTQIERIREWNRKGKPSSYVDPPSFEYMPKFPKALEFIKSKGSEVSTILDIGCYTGFFIRKLAELGYNCYGTDIQHELMHELNIAHQGNPRFFYVNADAISKQFRKLRFDCVTLFDVLEHVLDDKKVIREAEKVTRDGGWILIHLPRNFDYPDDSGEHVRNYGDKEIHALFGNKKDFNFTRLTDEHGRPTSFISYKV